MPGAGLGNVSMGGNHVHRQVFRDPDHHRHRHRPGIGGAAQRGAALDLAAAVFGVGVGLTVDEFALWLHLEDVYWAEQGRKSVDAIFCVFAIIGALIGGTDFVTGRIGTAVWWSSVAVLAANLVLCVICLLKGKVVTGVIGVFIIVVAIWQAPSSWPTGVMVGGAPLRLPAAARQPRCKPLRPASRGVLEPAAGLRCRRPPQQGQADGLNRQA